MTAPRAIGLAALSALLVLAVASRCASGGAKPAPADAPGLSPEDPAAPPAEPAATPASGPVPSPGRIDFTAQVLPVLQQKCSPCHFPGGRMHDRLPFDQEGTIRLLGMQLFSRLREPLDQELIRMYLDQP